MYLLSSAVLFLPLILLAPNFSFPILLIVAFDTFFPVLALTAEVISLYLTRLWERFLERMILVICCLTSVGVRICGLPDTALCCSDMMVPFHRFNHNSTDLTETCASCRRRIILRES